MFLFVASYRTIGTTHLGGACRFYPSCSDYGLEAIEKHNSFIATKLILTRICRCRPCGPVGYDPVPDRETLRS